MNLRQAGVAYGTISPRVTILQEVLLGQYQVGPEAYQAE
jgi:hypothetical protein